MVLNHNSQSLDACITMLRTNEQKTIMYIFAIDIFDLNHVLICVRDRFTRCHSLIDTVYIDCRSPLHIYLFFFIKKNLNAV